MSLLYRILFILGLVIAAVLFLQTCKDSSSAAEEVDETPAMSISAEAPESVDVGEVYSLAIAGENADGPVDLQYTLSRPGVEDSSVTRSVSPSSGQFSDNFSVTTRIAGNHDIVYSASDGDDDLNGAQTVTVIAAAEDSTMSIVVEAPASASESDGYTVTFSGSAADSDVSVEYTLSRPSVADSSASRTLEQTQGAFTDSFDVPPGNSGTHQLTYRFSDNDDTISGEQVVDVQAQPAMTLSVTSPDAVTLGNSYAVNFSGTQADSPVDVDYVFSRQGQADSTVSRTLQPENGIFTDSFDVNAKSAGVQTLEYRFSDSDDTKTGTASVSVTVPDDNVSDITITGPQGELYTGQQLQFNFEGEDIDGIDDVIIGQNFNDQSSSETIDEVPGTTYQGSLSRTFSEPGNFSLSMEILDDFGRRVSQQQTFTITEQEDSPANISLTATSGRGEQNISLSANDPDGFKQATLEYVLNGVTNDVPLDISGNTLQATKTLSELGEYTITLRATDQLDNEYVRTARADVLAELAQRQITLDAEYSGIEGQLSFDFDGQTINGVTNNDGLWRSTVTAPVDSIVNYVVSADALGLQEGQKNDASTGNNTTVLDLQAVLISVGSTLPGQYPRTTDEQDLSQIVSSVDDGVLVPLTYNVLYNGGVFNITKTGDTSWEFATSQSDPAGVSDTFTLQVSHPYLTVTQDVSKEVFERRNINVSLNNLQGREDSDIVLENFRSYAQSEAEVVRDTLYSNQAGIAEIIKNGQDYIIKPEEGFTGSTAVTAEYENRDGKIVQQEVLANFAAAPRANLSIKIAATDELTEGYAIFRDENGAKIDSVATNTGTLEAKIPQGATKVYVAQKNGNEVESFEHGVFINDQESFSQVIPVTNNTNYDLAGNEIGTINMFDMKRLQYLVKIIHGNAPWIPLDGSSNGGGFGGVLHRPTESANGMSYDNLVIADTTDWVLFNEQAVMYPGNAERAQYLYQTEIAPLMGQFATPVVRRDRITYDHGDRVANVVYVTPRLFFDGTSGSINVLGKLPATNEQSLIQLLSDGDRKVLSDEVRDRTLLQEITDGMIYFSGLGANFGNSTKGVPIEYRLNSDESITSNPSTRTDLSKFDRKVGWIVYDPDNQAGEKIDDLLRRPDAWGSTYDSL